MTIPVKESNLLRNLYFPHTIRGTKCAPLHPSHLVQLGKNGRSQDVSGAPSSYPHSSVDLRCSRQIFLMDKGGGVRTLELEVLWKKWNLK